MKKIIILGMLALLSSCATYNIIIVADKEFMEQVKSDYNTLYMQNLINKINFIDVKQMNYDEAMFMTNPPKWPESKFQREN